ncbi:MAG: alpha/beta hydrolase [Hydrogenophaga sp.]|uniref:alpha/beta fold hydrolase n=1 Tax=Hydrogenophaga sp. TaxID=1904254 RepID=UPI00275C1F87|nr:alpha/beta hydrolase [Hydrogenophaga sp.]MDP2417369.1 alpha/beta hydrolase [Hydrogenophaga sp.]MDZ4186572.1 alpha/beta hydrolase [Hydrogenophaga sp.]
MQQPLCHHLAVSGPTAHHGGQRRIAYWEWPAQPGAVGRRVVVCVHGLSRQGRDFDALAQVLRSQARVLAVDVAGRGESDWLADPAAYHVGTYAADLAALVLKVRADRPDAMIDWVGTSMGGLIGMALAAQPALGLRRLVLNDVGPVIQWEALQRIGSYLGLAPSFASERDAVDYLASISSGFGPHTPEQWLALSRPMLRVRDGRWCLHYDPAIAVPFRTLIDMADEATARKIVREGEAALWALFDAITAPVLLLRGAESDLLTRDTATQMAGRGPRAHCIEFAHVGHAPTLVAADQIAAVQAFLEAP